VHFVLGILNYDSCTKSSKTIVPRHLLFLKHWIRNEPHPAMQRASLLEVSGEASSSVRRGSVFILFFPLFTYLSVTRCFIPTIQPSQSQRKKISGQRKGA